MAAQFFDMAETPPGLAIPTFLAEWRSYRKLNQDELADRAGLTTSSISQLENGKQGFSDKSLVALSKALGCTPIALLVHNPKQADSFWPLFELAEALEGAERKRAYRTIRSALDADDEA